MSESVARTIAALRQHATATALSCQELRAADVLAICDAAEAGLRCPPREPTQEMYNAGEAVILAAFQNGAWACANNVFRAMCDAAPESAAPAYTTGHCKEHAKKGGCQLHNLHCGWPECDRKPTPAAPAPDADGLARQLRDWSDSDLRAAFREQGRPLPVPQHMKSKTLGYIAADAIARLTAELDEARAECSRWHAEAGEQVGTTGVGPQKAS